ncbi:MAG: ABC transporter ATP-binding protein/permease [Elusimicrobiota bacterium]|nr:MAG: ABC transporter ATP-binding protein/permease [Elusimicrobiota bacterium]
MSVRRRLLRYLKPYAGRFAWACAAMVCVSAFNGLAILLLKPIVDEVFIAKDLRMLALAVAGVPLLVALKAVASYVQSYLMSWIGQRVSQEIREDLFRHLHLLPLEFYSGLRGADVLSRVTGDLTLAQSALTTLPVYLIRDTLTVAFLVASLFKLDWRFALLTILCSPLSLAALLVLSKKMRAASRQSQIAVDRLHHRFQESVQGMLTVKAFNYEEGATEKFQEENESFFQPMMRYLRATALMNPLLELGASVMVAAVIWFGGREVITGRMTPGAFFAFLGAMLAAYAPIKNLARVNAEGQRAWASAERLFRLLEEKPAVPKRAKPAFPGFSKVIRLEGAGFKYPGASSWALRGLDLEIPKGARVAIVGPSGCGKTTVAKLLLRLHDPAEGRVTFDGADAREFDASSLRARAGLVAADSMLFNDTVFQNLAIGRKVVTLSEVERAARAAGADGFVAALPEGYQTTIGDWGFSLSTGQRQKLAIARVLLKDPELVVLDEATSHLDAKSRRDVLAAMDAAFAGRTVVTITHDLLGGAPADLIYVLNSGGLAESGTHADLMKAGGLYRRLYELQSAARASDPEALA